MSKKNKDIELIEKEETITYQGQKYNGSTLWMGKRLIGNILKKEQSYIAFLKDDEDHIFKGKTVEEATEALIREWHLNQL